MITLKLKIADRGLIVEIPGIAPVRTPADIDISKIDINLVVAHLRKAGINNYKIVSVIGDGTEKVVSIPQVLKKKVKEKLAFFLLNYFRGYIPILKSGPFG